MREHGLGADRRRMPAACQRLARQIEPADARILVEVAQDVGELQRAAEMMGERARRARRPGRRCAPTAARPRSPPGRNRGRASPSPGARMSAAASISMPSMTARKSSRRRPNGGSGPASAASRAGDRAGVERVDIGAPALELGQALVARPVRRRRCRRPRGRRRRSRTSPRAAPAAGCAWPSRTSCRRPAAAERRRRPCRRGRASCAPARTDRPAAAGWRAAPGSRRRRKPSARSRPCRDARARSADRGASSAASRRAASRWIAATSSASRMSAMRRRTARSPRAGRSVRAARSRRQARSAGAARSRAERPRRVAPCRGERVEREIDAVEAAVILAAILQVVDDLQRRAQRVGGRPGRAVFAVHVEHEAADRHGRVAAIVHELVPVGVAQLGDVAAGRPRAGRARGAAVRPRSASARAQRLGLGVGVAAPGERRRRAGRAARASRPASASDDRRCRRRRARSDRRRGSGRGGAR